MVVHLSPGTWFHLSPGHLAIWSPAHLLTCSPTHSVTSFDGVYASKQQRLGGGGCLELVAAMDAELGLEEGSLTGTWDYAHILQIIWKNSLAKHPKVEGLISMMFDVMDHYRVGKASTEFREKAEELQYHVLSNKKSQTTR